ncbi:MAG: alpha-ketoglutarate-dependent dioxygenase AlkB [Pyrinomonadaceae bacterium]
MGVTDPKLPNRLRYQRELISSADEVALIERVGELPFKEFEFHGYLGKRRVVSFGWHYEFSGAGVLRQADDIPEFLLPLRKRAAVFAKLKPDELQHVLVIEYRPGAGIGWHRDKPVFGEVVGVSLLAPCVIRFRKGEKEKGEEGKVKTKWERVNLLAEPRSAYHLSGQARLEWQHSILSVDALRYSVTFRTVR